MLVSLTTGLSLTTLSHWWHGVGYGALYGLAVGMVVFLAKGALKSKDAPYSSPPADWNLSKVQQGRADGLPLRHAIALRVEESTTGCRCSLALSAVSSFVRV